jgi:hypothetical protein
MNTYDEDNEHDATDRMMTNDNNDNDGNDKW